MIDEREEAARRLIEFACVHDGEDMSIRIEADMTDREWNAFMRSMARTRPWMEPEIMRALDREEA